MPIPLLNPYLDLFRALSDANLDAKTLASVRKKLVWAYSWAIPSQEALELVASHSPLIELGAGTGYWGWLCRQAGAQIVCVDANTEAPPRWTEVICGTPADLPQLQEAQPGATLLLVWPPMDSPMAEKALAQFTGEHVIYVGEWRGRTGTSKFHDELERRFLRKHELPMMNWQGYSDTLQVFSRR